jgi:predicted RNase H-like HicB family nuclease
MEAKYVLTDYVEHALAQATYERFEDGSFGGHIPSCIGVVAFGATLRECEDELRSTLEDWILLGLKLKHPLPVIDGIDLNKEPVCEPVDAV